MAGETTLAGRLHVGERGEAVSFEYDRRWLGRDDAFAIDPTALPLRAGVHHGARLFGALSDCGPDRWGRMLIERAVRKRVIPSRPFREIDYVLALDDASRIGALRFRSGGPFLADREGKLPPLVRLSVLLRAAEAIHSDKETARDLRFLLGEGSPLGGARPKSAVVLPDMRLAIAKFPKPDDTRDVVAGEILALEIAARAGIRTAEHRLFRSGSGTSPLSRGSTGPASGASPLFRAAAWSDFRLASRAPTRSWPRASGSSETTWRTTFGSCGGAWSFRCWRATMTITCAIMDS